jgi:hypothetical protein
MSKVSYADAMRVAKKLKYKGNPTEFWMGMNVESEHKDVTKGSPTLTGRIVLAHLREEPKYYTDGLKKKFFTRKEVGLK